MLERTLAILVFVIFCLFPLTFAQAQNAIANQHPGKLIFVRYGELDAPLETVFAPSAAPADIASISNNFALAGKTIGSVVPLNLATLQANLMNGQNGLIVNSADTANPALAFLYETGAQFYYLRDALMVEQVSLQRGGQILTQGGDVLQPGQNLNILIMGSDPKTGISRLLYPGSAPIRDVQTLMDRANLSILTYTPFDNLNLSYLAEPTTAFMTGDLTFNDPNNDILFDYGDNLKAYVMRPGAVFIEIDPATGADTPHSDTLQGVEADEPQVASNTVELSPATPATTLEEDEELSVTEQTKDVDPNSELKLLDETCAATASVTGETICSDANLIAKENQLYEFVVARRATLDASDKRRFDTHVETFVANIKSCANGVDCIDFNMTEMRGFIDALYPGPPVVAEQEIEQVTAPSDLVLIDIYRKAPITAPDGPQLDVTELFPLFSDGPAAYYLKAPFCDGPERAFDIVADFYETGPLSDPIIYRQYIKSLVANSMLYAWPEPNQCFDNEGQTTVRLDGWFHGEKILEAEFSLKISGGAWPEVVRYDLNLPPTTDALDSIAAGINAEAFNMTKIGYQSHKQQISDYINVPERTRQELIRAYLVLGQLERNAWIFAPRQDPPWVVPGTESYVRPINTDDSEISLLFFSRGPLAEEAYKIASDLGSGVATIDLVLSTGLFESLDLVSSNAKFQRALLPETTGILYDLYGSELNLALSRDAILAIKVREKLLAFGIDIAAGLEIDPNAPPTRWDIERAILRAMANNFEDQKAIMNLFAPRPAGDILLGACDDTWCNMTGDLWKLRISIRSAECEVNLPLADCGVEAKPVIASALPTSATLWIDERIVGTFMQGAAPYRPNRAQLIKQGGRWEYVGGLDLQ